MAFVIEPSETTVAGGRTMRSTKDASSQTAVSPAPVLRVMTVADLPLVAHAERICFPDEFWDECVLRDELRCVTAVRRYLVAEVDGLLVGYAGMAYGRYDARVLKLAVVPDARRRGVGRLLLEALLHDPHGRAVADVRLEVGVANRPALNLYSSLGFHVVALRRGYYARSGDDALTMRYRRTAGAEADGSRR